MHLFVAFSAQCDQVLFLVATRLAAEFEVVYLQMLHAPADSGIASRRAPAPGDAVRDSSSGSSLSRGLLQRTFFMRPSG